MDFKRPLYTQVEIAEEEEEISVQNRSLNIYDLSSTKQASILLNALKCKDLLSFKKAISYRKDPPHLYINDVLNDSGKTCLDIVSQNGLTEFVPFLLKIGADPNKINEMHNRTPILFAAEGRHVDTLAVLLEAKSTKPDLDVGFQTALHFAVKNDDLNCAGLLLKKGASASIPNSMGVTALHLAAMEKQYDMVELILNSQPFSDIDTYKDYDDQTTREIIQQILPELLLPKDKKSDVNVNNLKYYLITKNETSFLLNLEYVETETLLREVDESQQVTSFLEIAIEFNFEKAVSKILEKFRGNLNVMKAAKLAVLHGHYAVLQKLLLVEPKIVDSENELLLLSCQQLGIPKRPKDNTSDQLKCLKLILQEDVDVRCADGKGNSPLHYAARAKYTEAITLLLNRNSYIGHMNAFKVPPIAHIPTRILSRYFDDCIQIRKGSMKEYVIEFDYNCLMPHDFLNKYDKGDKTIREMEVFQYIARNNNLKQLLIHPILSSFLYLKWRNIRCVLYASFILHVIFYILLNTYIFNKNSNNLVNQNKTLQIVSDSLNITSKNFLQICQDSIVWILIIPLLLLFMFWEILQFISCPYHYLMSLISLKNFLHNILIVLTIVLMCGVKNQVEIDTLLILLSVWELITLISQHKDISTKFEMFRTVSVTYVHLFWPFVLFILAFALAFYTLFKEKDFSNFTSSIFKTIIMLTGEFDAGNIPFDKNLIWSHIVFILFLFFFTIVLLNLLNGLAVNDTAEILRKAELIKLTSSIHVVAYIENLTMGKLCRYHFCNRNSKLLRWSPFGFLTNLLTKKIFLFPHKMRNGKVNIKQNCSVNDEYEFIEEDDRNDDVNDDEYWTISKMDPNVIEQIKQNILNKNQLPDIEKMMEELNKLQEEMAAMKIALNTSKI